MQEIESAVRDLGGSAMQGIDHAVKGLNSGTLEGTLPFIIGVLILVVVVKCFSLPFRLIWNGICGAVALWFINLIGGFLGFGLKITVYQSADCGVLWNTWLFGGYFMGALRQVKLQAGGKL